jgi:hypothetical protein
MKLMRVRRPQKICSKRMSKCGSLRAISFSFCRAAVLAKAKISPIDSAWPPGA